MGTIGGQIIQFGSSNVAVDIRCALSYELERWSGKLLDVGKYRLTQKNLDVMHV